MYCDKLCLRGYNPGGLRIGSFSILSLGQLMPYQDLILITIIKYFLIKDRGAILVQTERQMNAKYISSALLGRTAATVHCIPIEFVVNFFAIFEVLKFVKPKIWNLGMLVRM
jgi:hypothetical protein